MWVDFEDNEKEFLDIKKKVYSFSLAEIFSQYGIAVVKAGHKYKALCPFHMDHNIGSFVITKHGCKCYACGFSGGFIDSIIPVLASRYERNFSESDAILQIAADKNIISKDDFERLAKKQYENKTSKETYVKVPEIEFLSDDEMKFRNNVYREVFKQAGLSNEHKTVLLEKRHVRDDSLMNYCSFSSSKSKDIAAAIKRKFPEDVDKIAKIPGFFEEKDASGNWQLRFMGGNGIGIKIADSFNRIRGIQIRNDDDEKNKYSFLSFSFGDKSSMFRGGSSIGTPVTVVYPDKVKNPCKVAVVEGQFKAEILAQQGFIALSIQGVNNFQEIPHELDVLKRALCGVEISEIEIFYDADMLSNAAVLLALTKLIELLDKKKPELQKYIAIWDESLGKGIDDALIAGNKKKIKFIKSDRLLEVYQKNYSSSLNNFGYSEDTIRLTKEERMEFCSYFCERMKNDLL